MKEFKICHKYRKKNSLAHFPIDQLCFSYSVWCTVSYAYHSIEIPRTGFTIHHEFFSKNKQS